MEEALQKQIDTATKQAAEAVSRILDKEDTDAKVVREMVAALKDIRAMVREQEPNTETVRIVLERDVEGFSA